MGSNIPLFNPMAQNVSINQSIPHIYVISLSFQSVRSLLHVLMRRFRWLSLVLEEWRDIIILLVDHHHQRFIRCLNSLPHLRQYTVLKQAHINVE